MPTSSTVSSTDAATAAQYNNLRTDVLTTHTHDGTEGSAALGGAIAAGLTQARIRSSALKISNPLQTYEYVFVASAIAANRNLTLPLLITDDTVVAAASAQTLTNKTLDAITLAGTVSGGGQQLNNIIIGTVTPLAVTATTFTPTQSYTKGMTLLKSGSGSGSVATAQSLDSIAITGLTAADRLMIFYTFAQATDTGGILSARHMGGAGTNLVRANSGSSTTVDRTEIGEMILQQDAVTATGYVCRAHGTRTDGVATTEGSLQGTADAWTGSWTLALYLGAWTRTTGSYEWSWSVYKLAGQ